MGRASCQATSTSGTSYDSHARFVASAIALAPHSGNLAAKRLQHLLHVRIALNLFTKTLLLEARFIVSTPRLAFRPGVLHEGSDAHLPAAEFAACFADELIVASPRERLAEVSRLGRKLDTQLAFVKHCRVSRFECRHQQHLSLLLQDGLHAIDRRKLRWWHG